MDFLLFILLVTSSIDGVLSSSLLIISGIEPSSTPEPNMLSLLFKGDKGLESLIGFVIPALTSKCIFCFWD